MLLYSGLVPKQKQMANFFSHISAYCNKRNIVFFSLMLATFFASSQVAFAADPVDTQ
jgi:hypothetical protein